MNNRKTNKEKSGFLKSLIKWIKSDADQSINKSKYK